jgi:hypothetical protein
MQFLAVWITTGPYHYARLLLLSGMTAASDVKAGKQPFFFSRYLLLANLCKLPPSMKTQ